MTANTPQSYLPDISPKNRGAGRRKTAPFTKPPIKVINKEFCHLSRNHKLNSRFFKEGLGVVEDTCRNIIDRDKIS